jgi:uncharacterized protein (TIGR03437 family)
MRRRTFWILLFGAQIAIGQVPGIWETRAPYPVAATEVSGAAIDGFLYVVCGLTTQGSSNRLYRYDPRTDSWMQRANLPIEGGADHCNVAAVGGKLYLLGAIRVGSTFLEGHTWEYDPAQDRWQNVGRLNNPRGASGVGAIGANIYVAGGLTATGSVADFEVFDTVARSWRRLPDMPTARDHLTAQVINGRLYAIGGRAGRDLTANEEYDPTTNTWRSRAPLPTARGGLGCGTVDNRIQVFGGEGNSGTPEGTFAQNEEYDPASNTWRTLAPMPTPRHGLYGITIGRSIFVPSGGPRAGANYTDVHEVFFLPPQAPPQIREGGVVNAASGQALFAPGSLISLFGSGLAPSEQAATKLPLPIQMSAVSVIVNGSRVPLYYVGPQQINFLLPLGISETPTIVVTYAGVAGPPAQLPSGTFRSDAAPGIFRLSEAGQGAVLISGSGLIAAPAAAGSRPVRRGEIIEIYGTGLGPVSNPPSPGVAPSSDPLSRTLGTTTATIGTTQAAVLYSGLAPGLVGVYQVNARVPEDAPTGDGVPLTIQVNEQGPRSNTVTITIQ